MSEAEQRQEALARRAAERAERVRTDREIAATPSSEAELRKKKRRRGLSIGPFRF
jgi:hypothetical protein